MSERELEDLQDLVQAPGWLRFVAHVKAEIDAMLGPQLERVADDLNDAVAAGKVRQMIATKKAFERLLVWPEQRIKQLQAKDVLQVTMTRGGR